MRSMERVSETPASVAFGRFRILPRRRELLADGQPIKLGGRAFDMLMALLPIRLPSCHHLFYGSKNFNDLVLIHFASRARSYGARTSRPLASPRATCS